MTSKQRAYLRSLAMTMDPIFQIGKSSLTPEFVKAISEALEARELIKISVLQNCMDDPKELAQILAERTRSQVVQVVGKKITLTQAMLTASSTPEAANHAGNLIDNNKTSVWASQGQHNVVIDLGAKKTLASVGVAMKLYDDDRTIPYDIEISADGSSYTKVWSGNSDQFSDAVKYVSFSADARYVRVTAYGNTVSGWNSVAEIEVYSK